MNDYLQDGHKVRLIQGEDPTVWWAACIGPDNMTLVEQLLDTDDPNSLIDFVDTCSNLGPFQLDLKRFHAHWQSLCPAPEPYEILNRLEPLSSSEAPDPVPAIWDGLLYKQRVALLVGLWKAGKSTLLSHLVSEMNQGGALAGRPVAQGRVIYITEEHAGQWAERRDGLQMKSGHCLMLYRPFTGRSTGMQWERLCSELTNYTKRHQIDLVILDTISNLAPWANENDATEVAPVIQRLGSISEAGACVCVVHHPRKGAEDSSVFNCGRGSGGIPAAVDDILMLRTDTELSYRRRLEAIGRSSGLIESPMTFDYDLESASYTSVVGPVCENDRQSAILEILRACHPGGLTAKEIQGRVSKPMSQATLYRQLKTLVRIGMIEKVRELYAATT